MLSHRELANALRFLSVDAVERAKSGHPGMPLGMADIAEVLWNQFLQHNPNNPKFFNRDRFILSNGHGSMLLYALLHLTGYDLSIEDLKNFRQLHSKTPGHPEFGITPGAETTTGPLGQGLANAVGFAIAEKILAAQFNRPNFDLVNHHTYVFMGDGCLMEGISHEVCSLAGTLKLGKLIVFWDDNKISIDGNVSDWFAEDVPKRFEAYGWQVITEVDGQDAEAVAHAIRITRENVDQPSLICCRTTIGFGSPNKSGKSICHGSPLGDLEIQLVRENLHWAYPPFEIPENIYQVWDAKKRGAELEANWQILFNAYQKSYPELAKEFSRRLNGELPAALDQVIETLIHDIHANPNAIATRKASLNTLNAIAPILPELLGGSADLSESNLTKWIDARSLSSENADANYIHYGVREFGMSAIMNGIALHGGFIPFGGTFLVFYTYAVNAVRMAALMKQRVIFVYTHDSIGVGEDGPTHQPIEQISTLRLIPNLSVWRPCDSVETAIAWQCALKHREGPTALLFSRQEIPEQSRSDAITANISRGGYILRDFGENPKIIFIATGSEVALAMQTAEQLQKQGVVTRVVSMPCLNYFMRQDSTYREAVLPAGIRRVAIEAGSSTLWRSIVGDSGIIIGIDRFGECGTYKDLVKFFKFTPEDIIRLTT